MRQHPTLPEVANLKLPKAELLDLHLWYFDKSTGESYNNNNNNGCAHEADLVGITQPTSEGTAAMPVSGQSDRCPPDFKQQ